MTSFPKIMTILSAFLVLIPALSVGCAPKPEASVSAPPAEGGVAAAGGNAASTPLPTKPLSGTEGAKELEAQRNANAAAYADYMAKQQAGNRP